MNFLPDFYSTYFMPRFGSQSWQESARPESVGHCADLGVQQDVPVAIR